MSEPKKWDERYETDDTPWDTGAPSPQFQRILAERRWTPCSALELGCGRGTNAIWLAKQGFSVTAIDFSTVAIEQARRAAIDAGAEVRFVVADVLASSPPPGAPFSFLFDRGCFHVVRRSAPKAYAASVAPWLAPNAAGLILAGNAKEPHVPGPPTISEEELRDELEEVFVIDRLSEFRFDPKPGVPENFLAWACEVRKR